MPKEIVVERYKSEKEYERGMRKMEKRGYVVQSTQIVDPGKSCLTKLAFGLFTLFLPKKQEYLVTYRLVRKA